MSSVLRDRVRAGKNSALRNLKAAACMFFILGIIAWALLPWAAGLGPGLIAAGLVLTFFVPWLVGARAARVHRAAQREGAFLTLLDAGVIRTRGNTVMAEICKALDPPPSPEASLSAVFFDDRRTGMMTLTVTTLEDGKITAHRMPAGTTANVVRIFCKVFPPTLPWQAYLLCMPGRAATVRHLMLDAGEAKALGVSSVDTADTEAMSALHNLPL